ncbi:MAG: adenine phosphoribosyltransferase [Verrucomicrobia bacterium]|nr:adenine phosphoribosyltransferase [Verrucomicrobiota bacterium]
MKKIVFSSLLSFVLPLSAVTSNGWIEDYVNTIPDFPIPGIQFKWYSPLLNDPAAFKKAIHTFAERYRDSEIDAIVGLDSRGFIFGTALAYELDLPLVLVRKAGKLPGEVVKISYELEYGKASFELEKSALKPGQKVLVIDDVIATGGTVKAAGQLVESLGASVTEVASLIELSALNGRSNIPYPVFSLLTID